MFNVALHLDDNRKAQDDGRRGQTGSLRGDVRAGRQGAPTMMMELSELARRDAADASDSATAVSRALATLSEADSLRLQALAHLRARGLPYGIGWSDLLHEAFARALDGSRQWPSGMPLLTFLSGAMRSICNETWRKRRREMELVAFGKEAEAEGWEVACPAPSQDRIIAASEAMVSIYRLFAGDATALRIISGLASGLSAEEIRATHDLSPVEYDSARRRMRRALLRTGLSWSAA